MKKQLTFFDNKSNILIEQDNDGKFIIPNKFRLQGRFPANLLLDEKVAEMLDEQRKDASRFFYCAKPSKSERNMGLEELEEKEETINKLREIFEIRR